MHKKKYDIVIVGAGISGSVFAERSANMGKSVLILDKRNHIGGNCYDYKSNSGIMVHKYGPHIFHTNNEKVWKYVNKFAKFNNYTHKVLSKIDDDLFEFPINRNTINKFFDKKFKTDDEVKYFLDSVRDKSIKKPKNSEDAILSRIGVELYEAFFKQYTIKQWDISPRELDRTVMERIPIRTNIDDRYFTDKFQGIPIEGYTKLFENMLNNRNIDIQLDTNFFDIKDKLRCNTLVYTGPIDKFFEYKYGKLKYRSLDIKFETINMEKFQDVGVVNYPNEKNFTRITEYKKFLDEDSNKTIISKEYPRWDGELYYPVLDKENKLLNEKYKNEIKKLKNVIFIGRLANYKYYNMDQAFENALDLYKSPY